MNARTRRYLTAFALVVAGYLFGPDVAIRLESVLTAIQGGAI